MQEVLRALIDRARYVNNQIYSDRTDNAIRLMEAAVWELEARAAERHGRLADFSISQAVRAEGKCGKCGHVGCKDDCH